jgi:hypothetical protein
MKLRKMMDIVYTKKKNAKIINALAASSEKANQGFVNVAFL